MGGTLASFRRSVGALDISRTAHTSGAGEARRTRRRAAAWSELPGSGPAGFDALGRDDSFNIGAPLQRHERIALAHHVTLNRLERLHEAADIADIDAVMATFGQRAAGEEMNIGVLAAHEQDSLSRFDAGV